MEKCERNILVGYIQDHMITENENIKEAMNFLKETPSFPESVIPNSIVKQKLLIDELERDYKATDIYVNNDKSLVSLPYLYFNHRTYDDTNIFRYLMHYDM
jgi:hypothetical protein